MRKQEKCERTRVGLNFWLSYAEYVYKNKCNKSKSVEISLKCIPSVLKSEIFLSQPSKHNWNKIRSYKELN